MCLSCMYYFAFVSELGKEKTELLFIICTLTPTLETNKNAPLLNFPRPYSHTKRGDLRRDGEARPEA